MWNHVTPSWTMEIATLCVRSRAWLSGENHARALEQEVPRWLTREHRNALDLPLCLRSLFRRDRQLQDHRETVELFQKEASSG